MAKSQSKSKTRSTSSKPKKGKPKNSKVKGKSKGKSKTQGSRSKQPKGRSRGRGRGQSKKGKKKAGSGKKKKKSKKSKDKEKSVEHGPPDVCLMVRRKKTTIFLDVWEDTSVLRLKRMIGGITKIMPEDQKLFRDREELKNEKHVGDYGWNAGSAKPQSPGLIGLVFKDDNGIWEELEIIPYTQSPPFPPGMTLP